MKLKKRIAWILLIAFVVMQFIRPDKNLSEDLTDTQFKQETNPPQEVMGILESTCYDCHSNNTTYPWYNNIAPVNYWIADHIEHGKGHLNFSEWDKYDEGKKDHKLEEVIETVESAEMPLNEYTWTHAEARLSESQRKAIIEWAEETRLLYQLNQKPQ